MTHLPTRPGARSRARAAIAVAALAGACLVPLALPGGPAQAAAPANDLFADAAVIEPDAGATAEGVVLTSDNESATAEPGEPNHAASEYGEAFHTVWWAWTAPRAGAVSIDTCGSAFNTRLAVYTGSSVDSLVEAAANNDAPAGAACDAPLSAVQFQATAGVTYRIAIDTDGGLSDGAHPRGLVRLTVRTPAPPSTPPDEPEDPGNPDDPGNPPENPDGVDTSAGTVVPVEEVVFKMPRLEPTRRGNGWSFTSVLKANKALGDALQDGRVHARIKLKLAQNPPSRYRDELYRKAPSTAILRTSPRGGQRVRSSASSPIGITVTYWSPLHDPRYQRKIAAELEAKRNRCKLLDASTNELRRLVLALTYDQARSAVRNKKWGKCQVWIHDDGNAKNDFNSRIFREYVVNVQKFPDRNGIGLVVTRPRVPDFAIVLREDPRFLSSPDHTSLVPQRGSWVFPASSSNTTAFTVQVVERSTGRLVRGADVQLWYVDSRGRSRTLLQRKTNGDGDLAVRAKLPGRLTLYVSASVTSGSAKMETTRQVEVMPLGNRIVTPCGRVLTRSGSNASYRGDAEQLATCRSMSVVPGNLGDGRGTAAPHTAPITTTDALTVEDGQLLAGTYNAVDISGENVIVGSGPGLLVVSGGNPGGLTGSSPLAMLSGLLVDLDEAADSSLSNVRQEMTSSDLDRVASTQAVLASLGLSRAPSQSLLAGGLGIIAAGGGNIIAAGGGNIIAAGGGNIIAAGGGNIIAAGGGNIIAAGGGNLMPVHGGQIIATGGLN